MVRIRSAASIIILATLVLLSVLALAWVHDVNTRELLETTRLVERSQVVLSELDGMFSSLKDAETGQRGFLLTGQPSHIETYDAGVADVQEHLVRLTLLMSDSPRRSQFSEVHSLVKTKLEELATTVRLSRDGQRDAALEIVERGDGKDLMDQIRQRADALHTEEAAVFAGRSERAAAAARQIRATSMVGGALVLALLFAFLIVVRSDLLGRRRSEAAAQASEAELRTTLLSIGDAVLATDASGRVTFLNSVAERLTGWNAAEAVGRSAGEVFRTIHEETREPIESPIGRVLHEGVVVALADHTLLVTRDGRHTPVAVSAAPILDTRGATTGTVLVLRDVTEQRAAARAVQRLAAIVKSSDHMIIAETVDGVITDWNAGAERLFGFPAAEMIGRTMASLAPPGSSDPRREVVAQLLEGRRFGEFETRRVTRDGRILDVVTGLSTIRDAAGKVLGISRIVRDVTERRLQREQLVEARLRAEEANATKDRFLANLSHELRTPLTPILATVHRLEQRSDLGAGMPEALGMIRRNVELEARLIDDLLDLTRIATGKLKLHKVPTDVHEALAAAVEGSRSEILGKGLQLDYRPLAVERFCVGDAARLQQIFWNLLRNAVKFTPEGGKISIVSDNPARGSIRVRVVDTGSGISTELLPRIFLPFVQGKQGGPSPHGGLGLGLSIARNLVEEHGGQISAESEGEGKGACFAVVLTTTASRPSRVSREVTAGARRAGAHPISVLVVEDDDDTREVMRQLLGEVGFDVRVAMSIESAIAAFEERTVEVLVSDIGLPDGSGHDLLGRLKALEPGLRAIVLSGYGMEQDFEKSRAAGFAEHFVKPVNFERLIATIQRLASGSLRPA